MKDGFETAFAEIKKQEATPYQTIGLEGKLSEIKSLTIKELFVNYDEEMKIISKELFQSIKKENPGKKYILIVGDAGVGKTTLLQYIREKTEEHFGQFESAGLKEINFWGHISAKALENETEFEKQLNSIRIQKATGVMCFDDIQDYLFGNQYRKDISADGNLGLEGLKKIDEKLPGFTGLVIITVTPRYFEKMVSQPESLVFFDNVIFLNGIDTPHLKDLLIKRIQKLSTEQRKADECHPFETEVIEKLAASCYGNPRLILECADACIEETVRRGNKKVILEAFETVEKNILKKREKVSTLTPALKDVLYNCAIKSAVTTQDVAALSNKERTTVSENLNELVKLELLVKKEISEKEKITYFAIPTAIREIIDSEYLKKGKGQFNLLKLKKF